MSQDTVTLPDVLKYSGKPAALSYADIAKHDADEIASFVSTSAHAAKVTYLHVAKGVIALEDKIGEDAAKALFAAKGIAAHTIKNARQATKVWTALVAVGHADEAWFDTLVFQDFRVLNQAVAKLDGDAKTLAGLGLVGKPMHTVFHKLETLVEVGLTAYKNPPKVEVAASVAADPAVHDPAAEAANAAVATKTETVKTETPVVAAVKAATATPSAETAALAMLDKAAASALAFIEIALDEVAVGRLIEKLAAVSLSIAAARDKRFPAKAAASTADLASLKATVEQHAAA